MYSFEFEEILPFHDPQMLHQGFYLWVWYADKIPPHIGCSIDGRYFSLKVNGKDELLKVEKVLAIVERKKIASLIIRVDTDLFLGSVSKKFNQFTKASNGKSTCLTPIAQILACDSDVEQLSQLLKYLKDQRKLNKVFGLNLVKGYKGIPFYSRQDIDDRLRKLENAQSKTNTSSVG
jgi:hypothetical protein